MTSLLPVTYDKVRWEPTGRRYASTALPKYGIYHPAVPARIADLIVDLPSSVLADAESASHEITRFDAELGGEIAPFAAVLLRSESAASSQIENLTASARAIAEAELPGGKAKRNATGAGAGHRVHQRSPLPQPTHRGGNPYRDDEWTSQPSVAFS